MQLRGVPVLLVVRSRNSAGKNSLARREWEEESYLAKEKSRLYYCKVIFL